jgi:hypothetical protein
MASITTVRDILTSIRRGAHSVSSAQIQAASGVTAVELPGILTLLISKGFVKEHRDNAGTYFTKKDKRGLVNSFIAGSDVLPGVFEVFVQSYPDAASVGQISDTAVWRTARGTEAKIVLLRSILAKFRGEAHAFNTPPLGSFAPADVTAGLTILLDQKLIKADSRGIGYYTRKPMRTKIDRFLTGDPAITVAVLMNPAHKNLAPLAPVAVAPVAQEASNANQALDTLIAELQTVRDGNVADLVDSAVDRFFAAIG